MGCCSAGSVQNDAPPHAPQSQRHASSGSRSLGGSADAVSIAGEALGLLVQVETHAETTSHLLNRVEECHATLARHTSVGELETGDEIVADAVAARGVALASFESKDVWAVLLQTIPEAKIKAALARIGKTETSTEGVSAGYKTTIKIVGSFMGEEDSLEYSGETCSHMQAAEHSASVVALTAAVSVSQVAKALEVDLGLKLESDTFMSIAKGKELVVLARNRGGWAYCWREECGQGGWLPQTHIAELATVQVDHEIAEHSEGLTEVLSSAAGDTLEVLHRHYSGWSLCRQWRGGDDVDDALPRKEGWITDSFLEDWTTMPDNGGHKFRCLVGEALANVAITLKELQSSLALARRNAEDINPCVEWTNWLSELQVLMDSSSDELQQIEQAIAEHVQGELSGGSCAVAMCDVESVGPTALEIARGDYVVVLHADISGWAWCRATATGKGQERDGWVPLRALQILSAPLAGAPPPASEIRTALPQHQLMCSICLEPLSLDDHLWSLPCAHTFHAACVGVWLAEKSECPLCRASADGWGAPVEQCSVSQRRPRATLRQRATNLVARRSRRSRPSGHVPAEDQPRTFAGLLPDQSWAR